MFGVNVIAHTAHIDNRTGPGSRGYHPGRELVTVAIQGPRVILAEFNTHRAVGKNVESSRAVSTASRVRQLRDNPYVPGRLPSGRRLMGNNKGMVAVTELTDEQIAAGQAVYEISAKQMAEAVEQLTQLGWHKQDINRLTEPFSWTRIIATATRASWNHFGWLRTADDVFPPFCDLARAVIIAIHRSRPRYVAPDTPEAWHLPYITDDDRQEAQTRSDWHNGNNALSLSQIDKGLTPWRGRAEYIYLGADWRLLHLCRWSAARCAVVSYAKFGDGKGYDDLVGRFNTLFPPGATRPPHASPTEHQGQLVEAGSYPGLGLGGNLGVFWKQYRKCLPGEFNGDWQATESQMASWGIPESIFDRLT